VREMRLIRLNARLPQIRLMAKTKARPMARIRVRIRVRTRTRARIIIN
jgi:hypothetical protein